MTNAPQWRDYRLNGWVLHREERQAYIIVERNHKERKVYLVSKDSMQEHIKYSAQEYRQRKYRPPTGKWRTVKELRKWYSPLNKSIMETLYAAPIRTAPNE